MYQKKLIIQFDFWYDDIDSRVIEDSLRKFLIGHGQKSSIQISGFLIQLYRKNKWLSQHDFCMLF